MWSMRITSRKLFRTAERFERRQVLFIERITEGELVMKIIHYSEAEAKTFDGGAAKGVKGRVVIGKADEAHRFCMRVFELAPGGHTPCHTHDWEHEIFIHSGQGSVLREGQWVPVATGNVIFVPGNEEHQIKNTGDEPFTFVCLIPSGVQEL